MRKILEAFPKRTGDHSITAALRDVFEFHGHRLSEEMCLGVGCGLGFIYWKTKQMPFPFVGALGGKVGEFEASLCAQLKIDLTVGKTASTKRAYETVREMILGGQPAMVYVDRASLPYLDMPVDAHFGGHTVVVVGLDEEQGVAYVSDRDAPGPHVMWLEDLESARASKEGSFPPANKSLAFTFPETIDSLEEPIRAAIAKNADEMQNQRAPNLGIRGIRRFAAELPKWPEQMPARTFAACCAHMYLHIELICAGGGALRPMYGRFLREAGDLLGDTGLKGLGEEYDPLARLWTRVAVEIRDASSAREPVRILETVSQHLLEIARGEEKMCGELKGWSEKE